MCFSDPGRSREETPMAYKINRSHDGEAPGPYHLRTRASVQRHINNAPHPTDQSRRRNNKRFPKRYNNTDEDPKTGKPLFKEGSYYEYPTLSWPYTNQNSKGKTYRMVNGERQNVNVMFTRTITDRNKNVKGVVYHPFGKPSEFERAEGVHPSRGGR